MPECGRAASFPDDHVAPGGGPTSGRRGTAPATGAGAVPRLRRPPLRITSHATGEEPFEVDAGALLRPQVGSTTAPVAGLQGRQFHGLAEELRVRNTLPVDPRVGTVAGKTIIGQASGAVRSGARGEFGGLISSRPATGNLVVCLRGHRLDLDLYDKLKPYSHRYRLHGKLCEVCRAQEGCELAARRLAEWAHLDVTFQHAPGRAPGVGLVLVARPPAAGRPAGRVELHLDSTEVGAVTASCRTATLDYVRVAAGCRRLGFGRTLVAAAVAHAPSYRWTAPLPDGPVAQSFRARIAMRRPGQRCVHVGAVNRTR